MCIFGYKLWIQDKFIFKKYLLHFPRILNFIDYFLFLLHSSDVDSAIKQAQSLENKHFVLLKSLNWSTNAELRIGSASSLIYLLGGNRLRWLFVFINGICCSQN